jgi:small-conductance mechanosensitive channel
MINAQIIETSFVFIGYLVTYFITNKFINNTLKKTQVQRGRRKIIIRIVHLLSFITCTVLLAAVWGLEQNEIAVFVGTIVTALGIAFFAQWSLLSSITSSILLFFNHPLKIGDTIRVIDKDAPVEGEVTDLSYFYVHLKTKEGEIITVPNSLFFQKSISIKSATDK